MADKVKRMNINVPLDLHNAFKATAAIKNKEMTVILLEFIRSYVEKHAPAVLKKGLRQ
jgi:hypothetical protein